ncbi:MAG TPA: hypothetical protein VHH36_05360 [Candidatus Thermoplasmatota archaeon]|nr:hypothetical protein [Candidatus Thermoplasmatota archaeon]
MSPRPMEGVVPWIVAVVALGAALAGPVAAPWLALSGIGAVVADLAKPRARSGL